MKLLIVSATKNEIAPLLAKLKLAEGGNHRYANEIYVLITGVGMTATAFAMGRVLATHAFNIAINLGIAGSFDRSLSLGRTVLVERDTFAELGAENGDAFIDIAELGIGNSTALPLPAELASAIALPKVNAITVNRVHGNATSIQKTIERLHPQIESMEGAAFFYSCEQAGLPGIQVRAISNYVEVRNKANWDIPLAVKNLNIFGEDWITAHIR